MATVTWRDPAAPALVRDLGIVQPPLTSDGRTRVRIPNGIWQWDVFPTLPFEGLVWAVWRNAPARGLCHWGFHGIAR